MKIFLKTGVLLIFFLISGKVSQAIRPDSAFMQANHLYTSEMYSDASALYLKIIESGFGSPELYYNLGNACFKMNDLPNAILYFEKARKLAPNDEDILYNLRVANTRIADKIEPVPELFFKRWWRNMFTAFSSTTWAVAGILLLFLFFSGISVYLLTRSTGVRKTAFYSAVAALFLMAISIYLASTRYRYETSSPEAIVFTPTITVKSSPRGNSVDLFVIHEGTKVRIIEEFSGWFEIRIASGSVGWLPADAVKKI
ncbi:MAG: tetratricopeptide repeat protein [Bacteroidales bacterium]|nr:tetratricopeptide repeat protein [Bacteroidales bacterium]